MGMLGGEGMGAQRGGEGIAVHARQGEVQDDHVRLHLEGEGEDAIAVR